MENGLGPVFPDPEELSRVAARRELDHNLTVADAIAAVDRAGLVVYDDAEDLGVAALDEPGGNADRLVDQLLPIRNAVARELRSRELLVATEIIDHLLFEGLKRHSDENVLEWMFGILQGARVDAAGFVVFGVHSLGLTAAPAELIGRRGAEFIAPEWGIAVSSQTNDFGRTLEFLDRVRLAFDVVGELPVESFCHWRRSRGTRWLESNPILAVRVAEASGTYFGNEALLLATLQRATSLVSMLAASQPGVSSRERATISTYTMNNQQTLDVHHYLVLSPGRVAGETFDGDCVPISRGRPDIVAMGELRMDFDPTYWDDHHGEGDRLARATRAVYREYLSSGISRRDTGELARTSRRYFESMTYFQRSFSGQPWRDIITLALAFEALLHEPSRGETSKRITNEIRRLIPSKAKAYVVAFQRVYKARNEILHEGVQSTEVDLDDARRAYVDAFVERIEESGYV